MQRPRLGRGAFSVVNGGVEGCVCERERRSLVLLYGKFYCALPVPSITVITFFLSHVDENMSYFGDTTVLIVYYY